MAKAKKQEKPIEQRLEETLVLYEKTPYELPSSWCWTRLGTVCKLDNGIKNDNEELFYLDAKTLRTQNYEQTRRNGVVVEKGEKVILVDGENSGEVFDIPKRGYMGSTFRILNINELVNEVYVRYFISSHQDELRNNKIGSAIPHLNKELFFNLIFPLAPLEEQKRIVEIIEKQFAKLDEARDLIQNSLDSFTDRKSAILHKAFTGELTKNWREGKGIQYISWQKTKIKEVCKPRAGYAFDSNKFTSNGYQIVRMGNLYGGKLDLNRNPVFIGRQDVDESILNKALLSDGDILISLTGTKYKRDYGYAVKIIGDNNLLVNQRILCLTPKENIVPNFVLYYLQSEIFRDIFFSNETGGVNQGNVSSRFVENIELLLPSRMEQEEIVRILDSIFEKEDKSKELLDMLDKIDAMKKSILARAFRGQLGTSNPNDEPATNLLRKILEE